VLGFGDDEINRILDYLYPVLANETQQHRNPNAKMKRLYYHEFNVYIGGYNLKTATENTQPKTQTKHIWLQI